MLNMITAFQLCSILKIKGYLEPNTYCRVKFSCKVFFVSGDLNASSCSLRVKHSPPASISSIYLPQGLNDIVL